MRIAIAAGLVLGVLSRVEEVAAGLDLGISSNVTWLAVAFGCGAAASSVEWAAPAGALALSAANTGYYAWVAATEPGRALASVAGPVERWYALGVGGGIVLGVAGALLMSRDVRLRAAAAAPLVLVAVAERVEPLSALLP